MSQRSKDSLRTELSFKCPVILSLKCIQFYLPRAILLIAWCFSPINRPVLKKTDLILSDNDPCFQCNIAITNFLVSHMCKIRFNDVIGQSTPHMYSYAKILKYGLPTWPNEYVLDPYFSISLDSVM